MVLWFRRYETKRLSCQAACGFGFDSKKQLQPLAQHQQLYLKYLLGNDLLPLFARNGTNDFVCDNLWPQIKNQNQNWHHNWNSNPTFCLWCLCFFLWGHKNLFAIIANAVVSSRLENGILVPSCLVPCGFGLLIIASLSPMIGPQLISALGQLGITLGILFKSFSVRITRIN